MELFIFKSFHLVQGSSSWLIASPACVTEFSSASVAECTTLLCVVGAGNQEVKEIEVMFQFSVLSSDTMCLFLWPLVWQNCGHWLPFFYLVNVSPLMELDLF